MTTNPTPALILLVEDDERVRAIANETLALAGYRVREARDGVEALEILSREIPDLIVSDVRMPRCDGFELLQWVRRNPALGLVPFLVVSAKADKSDVRMGMTLGADDYITKPYLPDELLLAIAHRLERASRLTEMQESHQWFLSRVLPHELRTPLSGILACGELIEQSAQAGCSIPPHEAAEYGKLISLGGQRLLRVAEDLSLWALLEGQLQARAAGGAVAGKMKVLIDPTLCERVLQDCAAGYGRSEDLTVRLELSTVAVPVNGPALFAAIRHLVDNALKFSLPGQPVKVNGQVQWERYVVEVADQGRGLSESEIVGLGALRQVGRKRFEQQGIGIGLSIIRALARVGDGSFALRSAPAPGRGCTAHLELPLAQVGVESALRFDEMRIGGEGARESK